MKYFLILSAFIIALLACCDLEAAPAGWTCGPNGCSPSARSSGPVRSIFRRRGRGPVRAILARLFNR